MIAPLRVVGDCINSRRLVDATGRVVAECLDADHFTSKPVAEAGVIAHCVNTHEPLVAALSDAASMLRHIRTGGSYPALEYCERLSVIERILEAAQP